MLAVSFQGLDVFLGDFFGLTGFERVILLRNDISFDATYFKLSSLFLVFVCLAGIAAPSDQILIECG